MKLSKPAIINTILVFLFTFMLNKVNAQKLPLVQRTGLIAPKDLRIDGISAEWGGVYHAYNKNTRLYYSIANNNTVLYLTIHVNDPIVIDKLLAGGITLSIFSSDKKSDKGSSTITFPLMQMQDRSSIVHKIKDHDLNIEQELTNINDQLTNSTKGIQITGISAIPDTLISTSNTYDIKVASSINVKRELTCELSIPLRYLQKYIDSSGAFKYDIKLNGLKPSGINVMVNGSPMSSNSPEAQEIMRQIASSSNISSATQNLSTGAVSIQRNNALQELMSPTDFTGDYLLIK